jgi:hypothetical protein
VPAAAVVAAATAAKWASWLAGCKCEDGWWWWVAFDSDDCWGKVPVPTDEVMEVELIADEEEEDVAS